MRTALIALAALSLTAGSAIAGDRFDISAITTGYTYYNRPGANLERHNADLVSCGEITGIPRGPNPGAGAYNAGIAFGLVWSGPIAGMYADKVENCMVVRGWRVVRLGDADGARLAAMPIATVMTELGPMFGAQTPPGQVVRTWSNLALSPDSLRISSRPPAPNKGQLSLRVLFEGGIWKDQPADPAASGAETAVQGASGPAPAPRTMATPTDPPWPTRPLKLEDIGKAPSGSAIIVVRVTGIGQSSGTGVGFAWMKPLPGDPPTPQSAAPTVMAAAIGTLFAHKEGNWFVLAVRPGRWRISGSGFLDYCFGSPSFQVAAGDVVYAGSFALRGSNLGPDLDLAAPKIYLQATGLAEKLRPAAYQNGATGFCSYAIPYALEFADTPFQPGYEWGSRAAP